MSHITIYQCFPAYKPAATVRLIKQLAHTGCKIMLDLEDSILDVQNRGLDSVLKAKARKDLAEIIRLMPETKFTVRINSVKGCEWQLDKELIMKHEHNIESIVIPKVESRDVYSVPNY